MIFIHGLYLDVESGLFPVLFSVWPATEPFSSAGPGNQPNLDGISDAVFP